MKRFLMLLLALALVFSCAMLMVSCGGEEVPCTEHIDADDNGMCDRCQSSMITPSGKTELDVTLAVKDHEGATVSGVTVTLTERGAINGEGAVSAVSGADGKLILKLRSSSTYLVSVDYDPDTIGFYALTTTEIALTESSTAFDIIMENKTPNGTESRPYNLSVENNAITVPAGKSVYYVLYRAMNLMASVSGSDIRIEYEGAEYTPDADGKISFPFIGTDMNYVATVKIISTGAADSEIDFLVEALPGTLGNPYEIETEDLGAEIANTSVTKGETVYYTFKSETAGTLTLNVTSADTHAAMQNNSYQVSTASEGSMTISLEVAAGDEVSINLTSSADENAVISFTLTCDKCDSSMITPSGKTELDVTLTVKDHEGATVSGVTVTLTERGAINGEGAVSAVSGADGKLTAKLRSSSTYLVSVDYDADAIGFYSLTTTEIAVTESSTAFDIIMENKTPNGSESRPYNLSVENNALTIPAGKTVYYVLYRAMNLMASVSGGDVRIEYEGTEYTPDADGKISFPFIGTDMNYVATVKITSTLSVDSEIDFLIEALPGTLGNPYEIETEDLGEEIENTSVTKGETVYYTFKAETAGRLTLTVTSTETHAAMQNNSYQVSTSSEGSMTISLEVAAGDEVSINLTSSADENAVITFTLTVE